MTDTGLRRLAWIVWVVTVIAYLVEVVLLFVNADLSSADPPDLAGPLFQAFEDLAFVTVGTLGLRLLLNQPRNAFCWWVVIAGLSFPLEGLTSELTQFGLERWGPIPFVVMSSWLSRWVWVLAAFNVPFFLLLYPDGHLPSPRWRPALWVTSAVMATAFVSAALYADPEPVPGMPPNPIGIPGLTEFFEWVMIYLVPTGQIVTMLLGLLSLVARYRHGEGVQRQQVKVLLLVAAVSLLFFGLGGRIDYGSNIWVGPVLNFAYTIFVGAAVTLAVLRYRLFEIDRLISRTVSYAVVAGALALIYVFGAVWLPSRVVGEQAPLFVAGSTLAVAALFNPVRRRVMAVVDRRFNRSSYDAEQVAQEFAARLRDDVNPQRLADDWTDAVVRSLEPSSVGVWFR